MKSFLHVMFSSTFAWAGNIYDLVLITYIYTELEKAYNINIFLVSLLFSLGLIGRFAGGTIFGNVADKIGRKPVLILNTAGYAIFTGIMAFSPDVVMLFSARIIQGIFMGGEWASGTVISYEYAPRDIIGTVIGVVQSGYGIGYAMTGLTYIIFLSTIAVNWRFFLLTGTLPLIIVPYALLKIPKERVIIKSKKSSLKPYIPYLIKITVIMSGMFGAYFSIFSFYPTIAPLYGIKSSIVGFLMIFVNIILASSFVLFGKMSLRINKKTLITISTVLLLLAAFLSMPFLTGIFRISIFGIVLYSFSAGDWALVPMLLIEEVPEGIRATLSGISYNLGALIGGVISIGIGFLSSIYGYSPFLIMLIDIITTVLLLAVLITIISWKSSKKVTA